MHARKPRKPRPPLTPAALDELALAYVGRFATTRSKLRAYLSRKLRERGWHVDEEPDLEPLVARFARSGMVDDASFAMLKAQSLVRRGYGQGRVRQQLRGAGVEEADTAEALDFAAEETVAAAMRFAERRRLGPFSSALADPKLRQRQVAAFVRAGHPLNLALAITACRPGEDFDPEPYLGKN